MAKKPAKSLYSVDLPDGTTLDYPAVYTARYVSLPDTVDIAMLPLTVGVEEQAFSLIGELLESIPDLEGFVESLFKEGKFNRDEVSPSVVVTVVKAALIKSPDILIRLGAALCELDEDGIRQKLTLAELLEMIAPAIYLERWRFETSFGEALTKLGFDLDEVDGVEPTDSEPDR